MSRTKRNAYTGSKRHDKTCRSHGGCPYCNQAREPIEDVSKLMDKLPAFMHNVPIDADKRKQFISDVRELNVFYKNEKGEL